MLQKNFFSNKSKGDVLLELKNYNIKFKIPKTIVFNINDWKKNKKKIYKNVRKSLQKKIAIRSSSINEDLRNYSGAGKYLSFLNVKTYNENNFYKLVNKIIRTYIKKNKISDQIIVQNMVTKVKSSGVVFTKDLENGANYYVINYDDVTGKTNTVTSGKGHYSNRILYIHKNSDKQIKSSRFKKLIQNIKDLETKIKFDELDIEFAINDKLEIFLLQVRPISTTKKWDGNNNNHVNLIIKKFEKKIIELSKFKKNICGGNTIFGNMPDWNPVEIIGKFPNQLSISLYKYLITDNIWAKARAIMGYKNLEKNKLMHIICGQPYIDTRLSLNSFLPKNMPNKISKKIVNQGINLLKKYPYLHDKIEFEISMPSFDFSSKRKIDKIFKDKLNKKEKKYFLDEIRKLTIKLIEEKGNFSLNYCLGQIEKLNSQFSPNNNNKIYLLDEILKKCKNIGTLNFSILARHGFIAKAFLNSLVEKKILKKSEAELFEQNLNTITSKMLGDSALVKKKIINRSKFMRIYGHLRPGTYDITSKRYDQLKYFKFISSKKKITNFNISSLQKRKINMLLKKNNFNINCDQFLLYIKSSLTLREYSKFIFTKFLSQILEILAFYGSTKKLSRLEMSNLDIKYFIKKRYKNLNKQFLIKQINKTNSKKKLFSQIKLPSLILDSANLRVIPYQVNLPNFVTKKKVSGEYIQLNISKNIQKLDNKIVVIENADPGYDWIFGHKILGLVTKFGGINSHMAIRCSELSIPAVIGCGEQIYSSLLDTSKNQIFIDCSSSLIYSN